MILNNFASVEHFFGVFVVITQALVQIRNEIPVESNHLLAKLIKAA